jgi:hypothetical protein
VKNQEESTLQIYRYIVWHRMGANSAKEGGWGGGSSQTIGNQAQLPFGNAREETAEGIDGKERNGGIGECRGE